MAVALDVGVGVGLGVGVVEGLPVGAPAEEDGLLDGDDEPEAGVLAPVDGLVGADGLLPAGADGLRLPLGCSGGAWSGLELRPGTTEVPPPSWPVVMACMLLPEASSTTTIGVIASTKTTPQSAA